MCSSKSKLFSVTSVAMILTGCSMVPERLTVTEMKASAQHDQSSMFDHVDKLSGPLTLSDAMARAFKFNLDHKVKAMENALAMN